MKLLIVDDEPLARERLMLLCQEIDKNLELLMAENGLQAIEQVNQTEPDVVLMDIRMPGMGGLEAARHLMALETPPVIIFTTAYDEYALQAFEAQAVDYLLKPIPREKLQQALEKGARLNKLQLEFIGQQNKEAPLRSHISAQVAGSILLIPIADILCFMADHKYITVKYLKNGQLVETIIEDTLKSLEEEFADVFIRIHRNALIRKNRIEALQKQPDGRTLLKLSQMDKRLEVSRRHLSVIRKLIKGVL